MSLKLYKPLTSNDPQVRLEAAKQLTKELLALVDRDPSVEEQQPPTTSTTDTTPAPTLAPTDTTTKTNSTVPISALSTTKGELTYAVNRLIKGLASGHESARFGFAVVLTELLSPLLTQKNQVKWGFSVASILGLVKKWMDSMGQQLTKTEEKDRWLGRLFGLKAVLMAGCLYHGDENDGAEEGDVGGEVKREREFRTVVGELVDLGKEKSWLRESAAWAILVAAREFKWTKGYVEIVWKTVVDAGMERSIEGVGLWLGFEGLVPGVMTELEAKGWEGKGGPLGVGNLQGLARALKESGGGGGGGQGGDKVGKEGKEPRKELGGKGVWNPKLHWVWDEILKVYEDADTASGNGEVTEPVVKEKKKDKKGKKDKLDKSSDVPMAPNKAIQGNASDIAPFEDFWRVVVDESLFSASSSEERKFHGFLLLIKLLDLCTTVPQHILFFLPHIFTRNLLRCLINHLSDPSRYLHKSAQKTVKTIYHLVETHPAEAIPFIVRGIVLGNGTTAFDRLTKTKTVEKLLPLAGSNERAMELIVGLLRDIIVQPPITASAGGDDDMAEDQEEEDERGDRKKPKKEEEVKRQWASDQLLSLIRNGRVKKHDSWTGTVVELFSLLGHGEITSAPIPAVLDGKVPTPKVSDVSREMFRARLASVLGHLIEVKGDGLAAGNNSAKETWPYRAVSVIKTFMLNENVKLAMQFDEEIEKSVKRGWKHLEGIRTKHVAAVAQGLNAAEVSQLQAFELLFALVLVQTYNGDAGAVELLDELDLCYNKIIKKPLTGIGKKEKSKKGKDEKKDTQEEEEDSGTILIEILLSFLSKPSVLLRKLANIVWSSLAATIAGRKTLEALMEVLETKESLIGQRELFEESDDGDLEDEEDDEDDDVEMIGDDVDVVDDVGIDAMDVDEEYKDAKVLDAEDASLSSSDSEGDGEGEEDEDVLDTDEETTKFEAALGAALKMSKPSQDDADGDDSDRDMTDSEMLPLDAALSAMFRERMKKLGRSKGGGRNKKKQRKEAKENVLVFKGKVVNLLEMWVKVIETNGKEKKEMKEQGESAGWLFLTVILPRLLAVMRTTGKAQLRERIGGVVKAGCKASTSSSSSSGNKEELWNALSTIHDEVLRQGGGMPHLKACSAASLAVVKMLVKTTGLDNAVQTVERITQQYGKTMARWMIEGGVTGGTPSSRLIDDRAGKKGEEGCSDTRTEGRKSTTLIGSFFTEFVGWSGEMMKMNVVSTGTVDGKKAMRKEVIEKKEPGKRDKGGQNKKVKEKEKKKEINGQVKKGYLSLAPAPATDKPNLATPQLTQQPPPKDKGKKMNKDYDHEQKDQRNKNKKDKGRKEKGKKKHPTSDLANPLDPSVKGKEREMVIGGRKKSKI